VRRFAFLIIGILSALAIAAPAMASTTVYLKATFDEPVGGPIHSPFVCPDGTSCGPGEVVGFGQARDVLLFGGGCGGSCDLDTITVADGSTLVSAEVASDFGRPGQSWHEGPSAYGNPFTLTLTNTIDGASSTGIFAGATGTLTGQVSVAGGHATVTLAGWVTLAG